MIYLKYSNCIIWAFLMSLRFPGSYVLLRKSRYGWFPHAMWSEDGDIWFEYIPKNEKKYNRKWWQIPLIFRGNVKLVTRQNK